jgi:GTP-binding protein EngB required for normal cell division
MSRSKIKNIAKYENRNTGEISYFSTVANGGDDYFRKSKNYKHFKHLGLISQEEQAAEEAEALALAEKNNEEPEVVATKHDEKVKTKPLTKKEIEQLVKDKKIKIGPDGEIIPITPGEEDDDDIDPTKGLK